MLLQFAYYSKSPCINILLVSFACCIIWTVIVSIALVLPEQIQNLQWIAFTLWSLETLTQILLNFELKSTKGQSNVSLTLVFIGKMTDFVSQYSLLIAPQFIYFTYVRTYLSSATAYVNILQYFMFSGSKFKVVFVVLLVSILSAFSFLLVLRTDLTTLVFPVGLILVVVGFWVYSRVAKVVVEIP